MYLLLVANEGEWVEQLGFQDRSSPMPGGGLISWLGYCFGIDCITLQQMLKRQNTLQSNS